MQLSVIIVLFGIITEIAEFPEAYKHFKPYKYYSPHPWRSYPRWHPYPKIPKHDHAKRIPTPKYNPYKPDYYRYAPSHESSLETYENDKPYIIIIQLPHRKEKHKSRPYQRIYVSESSELAPDIDEDDDYIDDGLKVYKLGDKKTEIKVNDRLSVLAS